MAFMSVILCIKKCQHNVAFIYKESSHLKLPGRCTRWLTSTLPTKFLFSLRIIQLFSIGGCCGFLACTCQMATILCAPLCPARTHHHISCYKKWRQWPVCLGTSKCLRGPRSSTSYDNTNHWLSLIEFKGNGIKNYIKCPTGLMLSSICLKFNIHILLNSCTTGMLELTFGTRCSK